MSSDEYKTNDFQIRADRVLAEADDQLKGDSSPLSDYVLNDSENPVLQGINEINALFNGTSGTNPGLKETLRTLFQGASTFEDLLNPVIWIGTEKYLDICCYKENLISFLQKYIKAEPKSDLGIHRTLVYQNAVHTVLANPEKYQTLQNKELELIEKTLATDVILECNRVESAVYGSMENISPYLIGEIPRYMNSCLLLNDLSSSFNIMSNLSIDCNKYNKVAYEQVNIGEYAYFKPISLKKGLRTKIKDVRILVVDSGNSEEISIDSNEDLSSKPTSFFS